MKIDTSSCRQKNQIVHPHTPGSTARQNSLARIPLPRRWVLHVTVNPNEGDSQRDGKPAEEGNRQRVRSMCCVMVHQGHVLERHNGQIASQVDNSSFCTLDFTSSMKLQPRDGTGCANDLSFCSLWPNSFQSKLFSELHPHDASSYIEEDSGYTASAQRPTGTHTWNVSAGAPQAVAPSLLIRSGMVRGRRDARSVGGMEAYQSAIQKSTRR